LRRHSRRASDEAPTQRCLPACPEFTLPADVSASDRFYARDTDPFVLEDRHIRVPTGPGIGADVLPDDLDEVTVSTTTVAP